MEPDVILVDGSPCCTVHALPPTCNSSSTVRRGDGKLDYLSFFTSLHQDSRSMGPVKMKQVLPSERERLLLNHYVSIGDAMRAQKSNSTCTQNSEPSLDQILKTVEEGEFVVLLGSSGHGKTQQAFALSSPVILLPMLAGEVWNDNFTDVFRGMMDGLHCSLTEDCKLLGQMENLGLDRPLTYSMVRTVFGKYSDHKSMTAGFFKWALGTLGENSSLPLSMLTASASSSEISLEPALPGDIIQLVHSQNNVTVFIDNFSLDHPLHQLLRDLCRVWGMKTVLATTDALLMHPLAVERASRISRVSERSYVKHCHVVYKMPLSLKMESLMSRMWAPSVEPHRWQSVLQYCLKNCHPLFANLLDSEFLSRHSLDWPTAPYLLDPQNPTMISMLNDSASGELRSYRTLFDFIERVGLIGSGRSAFHFASRGYEVSQVCFLLSLSCRVKSDTELSRMPVSARALPMVSCHFADLVGQPQPVYRDELTDRLCIRNPETPSGYSAPPVIARFPSVASEPVLFLASFARPCFRFPRSGGCVSFVDALMNSRGVLRSSICAMLDPFAEDTDVDLLRHLLFGAAVLAAFPFTGIHIERGVSAQHFLHQFAIQFVYGKPHPYSLGWQSRLSLELLDRIDHFTNDEEPWPAVFEAFGCFSNLRRGVETDIAQITSRNGKLSIQGRVTAEALTFEEFYGAFTLACSLSNCQLFILLTTQRSSTVFDRKSFVAGTYRAPEREEHFANEKDQELLNAMGKTTSLLAEVSNNPALNKRLEESPFAIATLRFSAEHRNVLLAPLMPSSCAQVDATRRRLFVLIELEDFCI